MKVMSGKVKLVILLFVSYLGISVAHASTISLAPNSTVITLGNQIVMDLNMDFSDDPTLGGGLDIFYDGNVCDPDLNNDGGVNFGDLAMMKAVFFTADPNADLNGDGGVNFGDLAIMKSYFFKPPGPSALAP